MDKIKINIREIVKEEVDKYFEEVGFEVKEKSIGFEDDEIFLLSKEEYEKYKDVIPKINCWWWLRSPGDTCNRVAGVYYDGSIHSNGNLVELKQNSIRPALRISNLEALNLHLGGKFVKYAFPWIYLGDNLAIAEVPISFNKFDDTSNDYENSYVRKFLNVWKYKI